MAATKTEEEQIDKAQTDEHKIRIRTATALTKDALRQALKRHYKNGQLVGFLINTKDNMNALVKALSEVVKEGIQERDQKVRKLQGDVRTERSKSSALQEKIGSLELKLKRYEMKIERLQKQIEQFENGGAESEKPTSRRSRKA